MVRESHEGKILRTVRAWSISLTMPKGRASRNTLWSLLLCLLALLFSACSLHGSSLSTISVQHNADGTTTHQVRAGRFELQTEVERHLLASIESPSYELVNRGRMAAQPVVEQPAEQGLKELSWVYWIRYRCVGKE